MYADDILEIACIITGIFIIVCAVFDWDFFMDSPTRKGSFLFKLLGIKDNRQKQRIFYVVISVILISTLTLNFLVNKQY